MDDPEIVLARPLVPSVGGLRERIPLLASITLLAPTPVPPKPESELPPAPPTFVL